MINLIITVIAIALVVVLTATTVFYSGDAATSGVMDAEIARYLNEISQFKGAFKLYSAQGNSISSDFEIDNLVERGYLSSIPDNWSQQDNFIGSNISFSVKGPNEAMEQEICSGANEKLGYVFDSSEKDVIQNKNNPDNPIPLCESELSNGVPCCVISINDKNLYWAIARKDNENSKGPSEPDFIVSTTEEWAYDEPPVTVYDTVSKDGRTSPNWKVKSYDFDAKYIDAYINRSEDGTQYKYIINTYNSGKIERVKTAETKDISVSGRLDKRFDLTKECFYSTYNYLIYHKSFWFNDHAWDIRIWSEPVAGVEDRDLSKTKEEILVEFQNKYDLKPGPIDNSHMYGTSTLREYYPICPR